MIFVNVRRYIFCWFGQPKPKQQRQKKTKHPKKSTKQPPAAHKPVTISLLTDDEEEVDPQPPPTPRLTARTSPLYEYDEEHVKRGSGALNRKMMAMDLESMDHYRDMVQRARREAEDERLLRQQREQEVRDLRVQMEEQLGRLSAMADEHGEDHVKHVCGMLFCSCVDVVCGLLTERIYLNGCDLTKMRPSQPCVKKLISFDEMHKLTKENWLKFVSR